jgi:hypothetical protein
LEEIGEACLAIDPSLKSVIDPVVPLTQYAWEFRYPGDPEEPTMEENSRFEIRDSKLGDLESRIP